MSNDRNLSSTLPLTVWQLLHLSCGTPRRPRGYEPENKEATLTLIIASTLAKNGRVIKVAHLSEALLAVVLEVFGIDVDVVLVDAVRLRELDGVLDELLHLHRGLMSAQLLEGLHGYVG